MDIEMWKSKPRKW